VLGRCRDKRGQFLGKRENGAKLEGWQGRVRNIEGEEM